MTIESNNTNVGATRETTQCQVDADEPVSMAVVRAVAAASGRKTTEADGGTDALDPLAQAIDPEALDTIFESSGNAVEDATFVEFQYCGHQVSVKGANTVCVTVE